MNRHKLIWGSAVCLGLIAGGVGLAQSPALWHHHPNLAQAEQLTHQADGYLLAAQRANHWDMDGHAAHAEALLRQADQEIHAAAIAADHEGR